MRALLAAHGLGWRWALASASTWLGVAVLAAVSLPLRYPLQAGGQMVDSAVVVALLLPVSVMARVLDEGAPHLIAAAARPLHTTRLVSASGYLLASVGGAALTGPLAPVPPLLVIADALLFAALTVAGVGLLGSRLGWFLPLACALVASAPRLVPWQTNLLYRQDTADLLLATAAVVAVAGVALYLRHGSLGIAGRGAVREADATITA